MTIIEHLEALRRALIVALVAWTIGTVVAFFISGRVIGWLIDRAGIGHAIYLQPAGGVLLELKVALYIGVIIAAPVVIQQVWWFVSPGLHPHERRFILPLIVATIFFFAIGVGVALFALPLYLKVLNSFCASEYDLPRGHQRARELRAVHGDRLRMGVRAARGAVRPRDASHHQLEVAAQESRVLVPRPRTSSPTS